MHIIARKYLEKRASAAEDAVQQLAAMNPNAYSMLGDPGMYGMYSQFSPESQYINATAPSALRSALYGGVGGLGASYALTGLQGLSDLKLPSSMRNTAILGGGLIGGLFGLGKSTGQYITGKQLPLS